MLKFGKIVLRTCAVIFISSVIAATLMTLGYKANVVYKIDHDWEQYQYSWSWLSLFGYSLFFTGGGYLLFKLITETMLNPKYKKTFILIIWGCISTFAFQFIIYSLSMGWGLHNFRSLVLTGSLMIIGASFPFNARLWTKVIST